jgi:hypothetical protein
MLAKLTVTSLTALILVLSIKAQQEQPCRKALNEAPAIYGLKLGMSFEEVRPVFGEAKVKPKKTGEGSYFLDFNELPPPERLKGVRVAYLRFFDSKLYQIEIFYDDKDQATKLEDFTNQLSTDLNLPSTSWKIKNGLAEINCGDFVLTADTVLNRHIELTDDAALTEFKKKKQQKKESKKKKNS